MVNAIVTIVLVILFFLLGHIVQAFKKLLGLITSLFLKFLNLFGIKIAKHEKHLKQSKLFEQTYKEIKIVKLSKKNIKQKSSIDFVGLAILIIAGLLVLINFKSVSGNAISNWLFSIQPILLIKTAVDMNTFFTATLFSVLTFAINKILSRWKETKQQRIEAKNLKIKNKALSIMDSKELVDNAKKKDEDKYKELK